MGDKDCASRREFLQLTCFTFTAAALGLNATDAMALPTTFAEGSAAGSEHRYPLPAVDGVTIDRKEQVIIVRYQSHIYGFNLSCPHENTALKWLPKDGRFQSPKHESQYQPTGVFTTGRATRNMSRPNGADRRCFDDRLGHFRKQPHYLRRDIHDPGSPQLP
jgi:nitrite reductase/ring-hydroxylating ferredoxin subunit